ncbi:MAG: hypothetical protein Kow00121_59910 [Elainellaceae cyanobacterium]
MPTPAAGPMFGGSRFEQFVVNDETGEQYTVLFLPDRNNEVLQREGQPAYYYYVPEAVRLARKGETGDYKFHHTHFVGTFDESTHVGLGKGEVVGGLLAFTVTSRYPTSVMRQAEQMLIQKCRGELQGNKFWGLRGNLAPRIAVCPMSSNKLFVSNISPDIAAAAVDTPSTPANGGPPSDRSSLVVRQLELPRTVPHGRDFRPPSNLDAWSWQMQGQGNGSITGGENAFSALIGALPSEIIWAGFHGAYSPIVVSQQLELSVVNDLAYLKLEGNWDRVFEHFSAHAQGRYYWASADIKAEFNNLRLSGGITVDLVIDGTAPGSMDLEKEIQKRIDTISDRFMQIAMQVIFQPAPTVEAAQAPSGGVSSLFPFGASFALKYRRDTTRVRLFYEERRSQRYKQPHTISSSMEGFFNEIKRDPENERKYFTRLVLGDLSRKVTRMVRPVANWQGDPIAYVSAQVGYPGPTGSLQWAGEMFTEDRTWTPTLAERRKSEVTNPPPEWEPDKTYVKRRVHFKEPPREADSPYVHMFVEKPEVEIDPQPNGTLTNDIDLPIRVQEVGALSVGPIELGISLENSSQIVEIEFLALGKTHEGKDRATTRFQWKYENQNEPRFWKVFTGQKDYVPLWRYRVHCTIKGSFTSKGMAWSGSWVDGSGNGSFVAQVPMPDDEGVTKRDLTVREMLTEGIVRAIDTAPEEISAPVPPDGSVSPLPPEPPAIEGMAPPPAEPITGDVDRMVEGYNLDPVMPTYGFYRVGSNDHITASETNERLELIAGWAEE